MTRGLLPLLAEGSARATDTDTTDEILASAIEHAKRARYCARGDCIVALHRIGNASVIKVRHQEVELKCACSSTANLRQRTAVPVQISWARQRPRTA